MITLRLIEDLDADYEVIRHWWPAHKWPEVPKAALVGTLGLVAEEGGKLLAASWVYTAGSGLFAWMEFTVDDPTGSAFKRAMAIDRLTDFAVQECERRGYNVLMTTCRQKALGRLYERHGFQKTDEDVSHFLKVLKPALIPA